MEASGNQSSKSEDGEEDVDYEVETLDDEFYVTVPDLVPEYVWNPDIAGFSANTLQISRCDEELPDQIDQTPNKKVNPDIAGRSADPLQISRCDEELPDQIDQTPNKKVNPDIAGRSADPLQIFRCDEKLPDQTPNKKAKLTEAGAKNFALNAEFYKRRFVGETSGAFMSTNLIKGNTVEDILMAVWDIAKPVLCREVVFVEDCGTHMPTWGALEPSFADINKFLVLQDHNQKRRVSVDKLDSKLLTLWRSKQIRIHVHIYSTSVSCKAIWDAVEKQLIKHPNLDRSGAPNNPALSTLADGLRERHGNHFKGHSSAWRLWANFIHASPAHERERRMSEMPPEHLLKFFRSVPISEAVRLDTVRSGLCVASSINDGYAAELDKVSEEASEVMLMVQRLKQRIDSLRARSTINATLVEAMNSSVRPEEDEFSRSLASNVTDMPDVDHS